MAADGAYDGEPTYRAVAEHQPDLPVAVIIPPRSTAVPSLAAGTIPNQRDQHILMIQAKGRLGWQKTVGYGRRSHAETAMFRYKALIGSRLRARTLPVSTDFTPQSPPMAMPRRGTGAPGFALVAAVTLVNQERGTSRLIGTTGKPVEPGRTLACGVSGIR